MNFLSHFYFDRHSRNPELVLGTVLPDLIKNANKRWLLHPAKHRELFTGDHALRNILTGWERHLHIDKQFHSSAFFFEHTGAIKAVIKPLLTGSPVRPSFLAHIALELMLDSLLLKNMHIDADEFYTRLENASRVKTEKFLELNGIHESTAFFQFFDKFLSSAYLKTYNESGNIIYALTRICMRLWEDPLTEDQKTQLKGVLILYQKELSKDFMRIFREIETNLSPVS